MKKVFVLIVLFSHIFFTSTSASLFDKFLKFISYKTSDETIPDLPVELWLKIAHGLSEKGQSHLSLVGHKFDQYRFEFCKLRCEKIGKKDAEKNLVYLGFFQPFFKKFGFDNQSNTKYETINNERLTKVLVGSYINSTNINYISACIQYSEIFLLERDEDLRFQIRKEDLESFGETHEEEFKFNVNEAQETISIKAFLYQNQPLVLMIPAVPNFVKLDHFVEFLKQLVAKYDNAQRIIIDRYPIQNPESFFDYFEAICKILGDREIVIQNKYGFTPLHCFFKNLQLDQIKQKLDPTFKKYQKYIEKNLNMRSRSGALPLMSVIVRDPLINYAEVLLKKYKANIHGFDVEGKTVLHCVICLQACQNKTEKLEMLIKHGANVNGKDGFDKTPLEYCTVNDKTDIDCAKILVKHGAIFPENPSEEMRKLKKKIFPTSPKALFWNEDDNFSF